MEMTKGELFGRFLILILIIFIGVVLRHLYNEAATSHGVVKGDSAAYIAYASNMLDHSVFSKDTLNKPPIPDAYWSPGYPLFLAATIKLALNLKNNPYDFVLSAQLVLGIITILVTYLVSKIFLKKFWPLLPTTLVAISPHLISIGQNLLSETLFGCLLILALYFFIIGIDGNRRSFVLFAGLGLAIAWLVNPVSILAAPLLITVFLLKIKNSDKKDGISAVAASSLLLVPLIFVILAWTVRTAVYVPAGSPTSSDRLLTNLIIGMHSDYHKIWRDDHPDTRNPAALDESEIDGSYLQFAKTLGTRLSETPLSMAHWYFLKKPRELWGWEVQVGFRDIYIYPVENSLYETSKAALVTYVAMKHTHWLLLICALSGVIFLFQRDQEKRWVPISIYITSIYICLMYIATQSDPRYSYPLRPALYIGATYFLSNLAGFLKTLNSSETRLESA